MAQTYEVLSIAAYLLAALSLLLAVFLWFRFKIWGVIGDLSGRTARKSIEEMRRGKPWESDRGHGEPADSGRFR